MKQLLTGLGLLLALQSPAFAQAFDFDQAGAHNDDGKMTGIQMMGRADQYTAERPGAEVVVFGLARKQVNNQMVPHHWTVYNRGFYYLYDKPGTRGVRTDAPAIDPAQKVVDELKTEIEQYLFGATRTEMPPSKKILKVIGTSPDNPPSLPREFRPNARGGLLVPSEISGQSGGVRSANGETQHPQGIYFWFEKLQALPGDEKYKNWEGTWVILEVPEGTKEELRSIGKDISDFPNVMTAQDRNQGSTTTSPKPSGTGLVTNLATAFELAGFDHAAPHGQTPETITAWGDYLAEALAGGEFTVPANRPATAEMRTALIAALEGGWKPTIKGYTKDWTVAKQGKDFHVGYIAEGEFPGKGWAPGIYVYSFKSNKGYITDFPPGFAPTAPAAGN